MILRKIRVQFEHDFSATVIFGSEGHGSGCWANGLIPYRLGRSESGFRVEIFTTVIDRLLYIELEVNKFVCSTGLCFYEASTGAAALQ